MSDVLRLTRAKREIYEAIKELEAWGGEEGMWRDYAIMRYCAALDKLRTSLLMERGNSYADAYCAAIDEMVIQRQERLYEYRYQEQK